MANIGAGPTHSVLGLLAVPVTRAIGLRPSIRQALHRREMRGKPVAENRTTPPVRAYVAPQRMIASHLLGAEQRLSLHRSAAPPDHPYLTAADGGKSVDAHLEDLNRAVARLSDLLYRLDQVG